VVVQAQASDRITKTGHPYNNTYCIVMRIDDGKVAEIDEYADTELVTSAFGTRKYLRFSSTPAGASLAFWST
jgi:ketosteroid isomerase-like protein